MRPLVQRIVARLRHPGAPLSRNRHFEAFQAPEGREALAIHRHVRSLERDILSHGDPTLVRVIPCPHHGDQVRVEVNLPRVRSKRSAFLTREELELLLETPGVGGILKAAAWE